MRIRILPTTGDRCLMVVDQVSDELADEQRPTFAETVGVAVDAVLIAPVGVEVDIPQLDTP